MRQRLADLQALQAKSQTEFSQERELRLQEATRLKTDLATEREARRVEVERFTSQLAALEAVRGDLAKKVGEAAEFKGQLQAAQVSQARMEEAQKAERERSERSSALERQDRRAEVEKLRTDLAAAQFKRQEKDRLLQELAAEKTRAAAAQAAREKADRMRAVDREAQNTELEKIKVELAAAYVRSRNGTGWHRNWLPSESDRVPCRRRARRPSSRCPVNETAARRRLPPSARRPRRRWPPNAIMRPRLSRSSAAPGTPTGTSSRQNWRTSARNGRVKSTSSKRKSRYPPAG